MIWCWDWSEDLIIHPGHVDTPPPPLLLLHQDTIIVLVMFIITVVEITLMVKKENPADPSLDHVPLHRVQSEPDPAPGQLLLIKLNLNQNGHLARKLSDLLQLTETGVEEEQELVQWSWAGMM